MLYFKEEKRKSVCSERNMLEDGGFKVGHISHVTQTRDDVSNM